MATHFSIHAWEIPWTEEPGRLQPMGSHRVGHDWAWHGGSPHHNMARLPRAIIEARTRPRGLLSSRAPFLDLGGWDSSEKAEAELFPPSPSPPSSGWEMDVHALLEKRSRKQVVSKWVVQPTESSKGKHQKQTPPNPWSLEPQDTF